MRILEYCTDINEIKKIQHNTNLNTETIEFLLNKGYTQEEIILLTNNNYENLLSDDNISYIKEASELISKYLEYNESDIFIFGDYDGDGINSSFIIYDTLNKLKTALNSNCNINVYIPQRIEGYGLNLDWCKELINNKNKTKNVLVVTVDNGISKKEEVKLLKSNNIEVLITDHHQPQEDLIPQDVIIVNPCLHDKNDKDATGLCGTSVIYKICSYLLNTIYKDSSGYSNVFIPNVAIATITDMMPVTKENIIFVKNGMKLINKKYCNKAIRHYKEYAGKDLIPKDIAFDLGPQLNSCGRMNQIDKALELFLSEDEDDIVNIYNDIVLLNDERKKLTQDMIELAKKEINDEDNVIVLALKGLNGVAGNVANQLLQIYNKPVILLNDNNENDLIGSSRSNSINLHSLLQLAKDNNIINNFGGHEKAAGLEVPASNINILKDFCNEAMNKYLLQLQDEPTIEPIMYVDKFVDVLDLNRSLINKYKDIMFFNDLKEPLFALKEVYIFQIGYSKNKPNNIWFKFQNKKGEKSEAIWSWKFRDTYENLGSPTKVNLVFSLSEFNGMLSADIKYIEAC